MPTIIQKIRDVYPTLSNAKKTAASYFLNDYASLQLATVTELAEQIGVSDTTIINLCSDLGFIGFSDFKRAVRDELQQEHASVHLTTGMSSQAPDDKIAQLARPILQNLETTFSDPQNCAAIAQAAEMIKQANMVYAVGFWSFATAAEEFCLQMRRQGKKAQAIYPSLGDYIDKILQIEASDIVLLYDFSLYTSALTEICTLLKKRNVPIILITDMGPCPRIGYADITIHCRTKMGNDQCAVCTMPIVQTVNYILRSLAVDRNVQDEYSILREGIFSRFNPYGVIEPSSKSSTHI